MLRVTLGGALAMRDTALIGRLVGMSEGKDYAGA